MLETYKLCIVIPCYNEEKRLDRKRFIQFSKLNKDILICFVNDGSSDNTLDVLNEIRLEFPNNIAVMSTDKNVGKAEAVRTGISICQTKYHYDKIAYLDADLSTSLEECVSIAQLVNRNVIFAFGSRISLLGSTIKRKYHRFLIGRIVATFISNQLKLKVYDTQCGCKVFDRSIADQIFKELFISKWLFDVEIFYRIVHLRGRENMENVSLEVPLKSWIDIDDSRVKFSYFFKLWYDLMRIKKRYQSHPVNSNE
jgi:glycosyltransferase involved in cell wall biosynthesis